jgi:hypothetical protein
MLCELTDAVAQSEMQNMTGEIGATLLHRATARWVEALLGKAGEVVCE